MGRSKKKTSKPKRQAPAEPRAAKVRGRRPKGTAPAERGSVEVERRWKEYWRCRKELEEAVEKVRAAESFLSEAAELERTRRAIFEETKEALKELLEVEPPSLEIGRRSSRLPVPEVLDADG